MWPPQGLQLRQWHLERKRHSCQGAAAAERKSGRAVISSEESPTQGTTNGSD